MYDYKWPLGGEDCKITVRIIGRYHPATLDEPEEWPDVEVVAIEYCGKSLDEHFFPLFADALYELELEILNGKVEPL